MQLQGQNYLSKIRLFLLSFLTLSAIFTFYESYLMWKNRKILHRESQRLSSLLREKYVLKNNLSEATNKLKALKEQIVELQRSISYYGFPLKPTDIENLLSYLAVKYKITLESSRIDKNGIFINVELESFGMEKNVLRFIDTILSSIPMQLQNFEISKPERNIFVKIKFKTPIVRNINVESK